MVQASEPKARRPQPLDAAARGETRSSSPEMAARFAGIVPQAEHRQFEIRAVIDGKEARALLPGNGLRCCVAVWVGNRERRRVSRRDVAGRPLKADQVQATGRTDL
jgi:hypothetical protein